MKWSIGTLAREFAFGLFAMPGTAMRGLGNLMRRKRVRGRAQLRRAAARNPASYNLRIRQLERACMTDDAAIHLPVEVIILDEPQSLDAGRTRQSVEAHGLRCAEPSTGDRAAGRDGWLLVLRAGDLLAPRARSALAQAIARGDGDLFYWDEDRLCPSGRRTGPIPKPAWDPIRFWVQDYVGRAFLVRADRAQALKMPRNATGIGPWLAEQLGGPRPALRPFWIDAVVTHRGPAPTGPIQPERRAAILAHHPDLALQPTANPAIDRLDGVPDAWPALRLVVPTRDQLGLTQRCIEGLEAADYPGTKHIVIVDNGSVEPATLAYFEECRGRGLEVIRDERPFNFSQLNNLAVAQGREPLLGLINNDIEMRDPDWLMAMAGLALRDDVGAVGAKLLYPDGTLQHCGVVVGMGGAAGHPLRGQPDDARWDGFADVARRVKALTAGCLLVRRAAFEAVGGFNEESLAVAYNDVDLCLKLDAAGLSNVYQPAAVLVHHESKSRGKDDTAVKKRRFAGELDYLQSRWRTAELQDPYYHPAFSRDDDSMSYSALR